MMKLLLFMMMMIPLIVYFNCWILYQFMILIMMVLFTMLYVSSYFCNISYCYGIDYFSYGLIILSFLISSLMIMSSSNIYMKSSYSFFLVMNLLLCLSLIIIFTSLNMFMLYVFFEFSLIPLMIMILGWGYQPERLISGLYLFFYTLFASLPLLLIIMLTYLNNLSSYISMVYQSSSFLYHLCLIFAFLVKLPMFMVHFWLPKAHVQSPISGSMILAGLLLKIGGYGIIRFMYMYEYMFMAYSYIWYSLSIYGSLVVGLVCFIQGDVKCLIAYSSVSHMGMCLLGLLTMTNWGVIGSYVMMIGHGLCSSGLFCLSNICYERLLSRSFFINKGMILFMPSMCLMWFLFCMFNMGCPPSINFLSEIYIIISMMSYFNFSLFYFIFISFFSACFSFYLFGYTQHGNFNNMYSCSMGMVREYLLMFSHLFPLFFIFFVLNMLLI